MDKLIFTKEGLEKVKKEHQELTLKRKEVLESLKRARDMGDLSENGLYKAAKFELGNIDRTLRRLSYFLNKGVVAKKEKGKIGIGSKITVSDEGKIKKFLLVNEFESNPKENKISLNSPLGKNLLKSNKGQTLQIETPGGIKIYKVVSIS